MWWSGQESFWVWAEPTRDKLHGNVSHWLIPFPEWSQVTTVCIIAFIKYLGNCSRVVWSLWNLTAILATLVWLLIALKFDSSFRSTTAEAPIKFQNDPIMLSPCLTDFDELTRYWNRPLGIFRYQYHASWCSGSVISQGMTYSGHLFLYHFSKMLSMNTPWLACEDETSMA